jgi:hypothetical protein
MRKKGEWGYNMPHGGERGRESGMTWHTEREGVAGDTRSRVAEVVRERRDVGRVWYGMLARGPA